MTQLTVFIATGEASCTECDAGLGRHAWITLTRAVDNHPLSF